VSDFSVQFDDTEVLDFSKSTNKSKDTDKLTKTVKIIFVVLLFVFISELILYKCVLPCRKTPNVLFTGQENYTTSELISYLAPMRTSNWFDFDAEVAVSILASVAGIDSVKVKKHFPNKIYINIKERESVAMTFINTNGRCNVLHIDESGVLFPAKLNSNLNDKALPIISGLPVEYLNEGMRIPSKYRPLITQINTISSENKKYFETISEICVVPKEYGNYELVLIPAKSKIRVLTDRTLNEESLRYMMVVLDVVGKIDSDVSEIDLRYGSVSYRKH
jgi:cell division protein FtsQ